MQRGIGRSLMKRGSPVEFDETAQGEPVRLLSAAALFALTSGNNSRRNNKIRKNASYCISPKNKKGKGFFPFP
jgi:hypothetical protein